MGRVRWGGTSRRWGRVEERGEGGSPEGVRDERSCQVRPSLPSPHRGPLRRLQSGIHSPATPTGSHICFLMFPLPKAPCRNAKCVSEKFSKGRPKPYGHVCFLWGLISGQGSPRHPSPALPDSPPLSSANGPTATAFLFQWTPSSWWPL